MFAFLFDRDKRGAAKCELLEVIWPDVPLDRPDVAFHRTLGGPRRTIGPDLQRGCESTSMIYRNDRYRLNGELIAFHDVADFDEWLSAALAAKVHRRRLISSDASKLFGVRIWMIAHFMVTACFSKSGGRC